MKRSAVHFWISIVLVGTLFISSFPSISAFAGPQDPPGGKEEEEPLTVEILSEFPLEEFPPEEPIILLFSEAMQTDSVSQPLSLMPTLEGQVVWSEDGIQLTYTPEGGFAIDLIYSIDLDAGLVSISGKQLDEPHSWEIHTLTSPRVIARSPEGNSISERFPIIHLTFDQKMDMNSVLSALEVEPEIEMEFGWGGQEFFLRSLTELDPFEEYHFSISQEAKDLHGLPMQSSYSWSYTLAPTIKEVTYPVPDNRQTFIGVEFNYGVKWEAIQGNLVIEPDLPGQWVQDAGNSNRILFIPEGSFGSDTQYTIHFPEQFYDLRGSELPSPDPFTFKSPSAVLRTDPGGDEIVNPPGEIIIHFDRPMDEIATFEALTFDPPIQGQHTWRTEEFVDDENEYGDSPENGEDPVINIHTLVFTPNQDAVAWGTQYTVTLATSAKDAEGNPILSEPSQWTFQTDFPEDAYGGKFGYDGANIQIVDVDGPRAIQFEYSKKNQPDLDFSLNSLTLAQFLSRYPLKPLRSYWHESSKIDLVGTTEIKRWTLEQPPSKESVGEVRIPADISPGIYVLNMIDRNYDLIVDQFFLVLSKNSVMVKKGQGQIMSWITDINGDPRPGVFVEIYNSNGERIDHGYSDESGVFRSFHSPEQEPYLVAAHDGEDISVSGMDRSWSKRGSIWSWRRIRIQEPLEYGINVYTDRPIYRPGQTVNFKAVVRKDEDAIISLPSQGTTVLVGIRDTRNNLVQSYKFKTNSYGTVHGEFILSEGAMVGDYTIEVEALGKQIDQVFKVQDYKKPDIQAVLETDADQYIDGEKISVTLNANYFFGEPVQGASVSMYAYSLVPLSWWNWSAEDDGQYHWTSGARVYDGRLTIENGMLEFSFFAEIDHESAQYDYSNSIERETIALEANIDDGSGQSISTTKIIEIFSSDIDLQLSLGDYFKRPGQTFSANASAMHISGEPISEFPLSLNVYRYNRNTFKYNDRVLELDLSTDEMGQAEQEITFEEIGAYRFELAGRDNHGNELLAKRWIYIYENGNPWRGETEEDVRIHVDKTTYSPGEVANLIIESTFDGPALLAVQRGTTRRTQTVFLTAPFTSVDLEIHATDSPNIFVSINVYTNEPGSIRDAVIWDEAWTAESLADSQLHYDTVEFSVPHRNKELSITITPDKEVYAPGEEATFSILVYDQLGNPVSAEMSLALIDEAIFSLSDDLSTSLYDSFYASRKSGVKTYNSMGASRWIHLHGGAGGGGGPDLPGTPRSDFPDAAAWIPILRTDSYGKAEISITLPDTLTTWRLTAKAVTKDTKVGEAEVKVITKQDVVVRPFVPRSLTEGDEVIVSAFVQNYTDHEREFNVLLMNTTLEILDPALQILSIQPKEIGIATWRVHADQPGDAVMTFVADDGDIGDAVQVSIPVQPLRILERASQVGDFRGHVSTILQLPEENFEQSRVEVELNRSIADSLLTGLEYLTQFPYGCVEQTMSRALPNAMVARAMNQLGIGTLPGLEDLPEKINAGLQRLYGYQHIDGGWGWWHDDDSHAYQTAWVVYGLAMTLEAGYEVDPAVIERGADWLSRELDEMDDRMKAYALYSMAIAGYGDLEKTLEIASDANSQDAFSVAALALALHELEEGTSARELVKVLESKAIVDENSVYWPAFNADQYFYRQTMSSEIRDTALALSAIVKIVPDHDYESRIVRWLMDRRDAQGWGDTHQTSYAILALTDHLLASKHNPLSTSYVLMLNGSEIASGNLDRQSPSAYFEVLSQQLLPGENTLEITQKGSGRIYYTINTWTISTEPDVQAGGNIIVEREYQFLSNSRPDPDSHLGQLVKVQLHITMPRDGAFIILEDKLPGGFEALNESLSITSHERTIWAEPRFAWEYNGYNHKEIRADRVSFFFTGLEAGTHTFNYMARVSHLGEFTAMPTQAWAMYDSTIWGRSSSSVLNIDE